MLDSGDGRLRGVVLLGGKKKGSGDSNDMCIDRPILQNQGQQYVDCGSKQG